MSRVLGCVLLLAGVLGASAWGQEIASTPPVQVTGIEKSRCGSMAMGGGEYVTGMVWCAHKPGNLFIRADGGGIWRFDRAGDRWVCLTDNIPFKWRDLITVDTLAVHPDTPDVIYIAGGVRGGELHDILKTEDGGKTWNRLMVKNAAGKPVGNDGNGENKQAGERLVIDINAPDILMFATRNDGLMTTRDAGKTWQQIEALDAKGKPWAGLAFVAGDFSSGRPGEPTKRWYVGVQPDRMRGVRGGLFVTEDAGKTWMRIDEGPGLLSASSTPMRARVALDGTVYLTTVGGGVWKGRVGDWHVITPADAKGRPFCGINLDPRNASRVVLAQTSGTAGNTFYYSSDAGEHWTRYSYDRTKPAGNNVKIGDFPAWEKAQGDVDWGGNASDIAFDPVDATRVWHLSLSGPCRIDGIGGSEVTASLVGKGREHIRCGEAISTTDGAMLISGVWGFGGFRQIAPDQIPETRLRRMERDGTWHKDAAKQVYQDVFDMDVQPAKPSRIVLCGGWQWNRTGEAAYSTDNGRTFREFATKPFDAAKFGRIAVGIDSGNVVWAPMGSATTAVFFTKDNGQTWQPSEGAPLGMIATEGVWSFYRCLAADRVRFGVFYLYDRRDGKFYRSEDGGARFVQMCTLPRQQGVNSDWHRLETTPWREDELWLSMREQGLLHSTDGGKTWSRLEGVPWAENITFGKPRNGGDYPAMYLFGQIGGEKPTMTTADCRLYRSDDAGKTWVQISDEAMPFGSIAAGFAGDMQTYGRVFITTTARGIFYVEPEAAK